MNNLFSRFLLDWLLSLQRQPPPPPPPLQCASITQRTRPSPEVVSNGQSCYASRYHGITVTGEGSPRRTRPRVNELVLPLGQTKIEESLFERMVQWRRDCPDEISSR